MRNIMMKRSIALMLLATLAAVASAQEVKDYRGGWIADDGGVRHVYLLVASGKKFTGIYCTDCSNPANLAIVDDGELTASGIRFKVYTDTANGVVIGEASGKASNGELTLTRKDGNGASKTLTLHRSPFTHVKPAPPGGFQPLTKAYEPPVTPYRITADKVVGLWLAGNGPNKQNFMFKRFNGGIRGMVCGPCTTTDNMAVLENVRWEGDKLHFDIAHEDSGPGIVEHGPHKNVTTATIARNEMHLWVVPSFEAPGFTPVEMTLLGPVTYQP
ncbi:MAG TPA: hypothetical protein VMH83_03945 [Candidatus Acidoferrum sp.]|nr:hypothetical protein [Candidatus Acidoferrum sp.]